MVYTTVSDALTADELDAVMETSFPEGFLTNKARPQVRWQDVVTAVEPLGPRHLAELREHLDSGEPIGVKTPELKAIRLTHHRLAQLLAMGMDETKAGVLCNYSPNRVSMLKSDPAFANLLDYYRQHVEVEWQDVVSTASALSMDFLHRLQEQLDETPEKFTPALTMDAIKLLLDRTGHAPVTKSLNVNVNTGLGDDIKAARERAALAYRQAQGLE